MTYDPTDPTRKIPDEDYRSTADRPGSYSRSPSNTGVIGAIIGILAVVAVVFFVWRGYDSAGTATGTATNNGAAGNTTSVNRPATAPSPAAPGTGSPDTTGTTTTAPRP